MQPSTATEQGLSSVTSLSTLVISISYTHATVAEAALVFGKLSSEALSSDAGNEEWRIVYSTVVRVHQQAASVGAQKTLHRNLQVALEGGDLRVRVSALGKLTAFHITGS